MFRRLRRLFLLLVVLAVVVVAIVIVLGNRSTLDHARTRIDTRWSALRAPLDARYEKLRLLSRALAADVGTNQTVTGPLERALTRWSTVTRRQDAEAAIAAANDLEGLASLARATTQSTDRVRSDRALQAAVVAFDATVPPRGPVDAYNTAVRDYEHKRTTGICRLTAALFGYDARRTFEPVTSA